VLAAASMSVDALTIIAGILGLMGVGVILARPFVGLLLFVFLIQLGGLVTTIAGSAGDYMLEGLVAVTFLATMLQAPMRPRSLRWGSNPLALRVALLFLLAGVISGLFAFDRNDAMLDLFSVASLIGIAFLFVVLVTTREQVMAILLALFASTALSAGLAALQYFGLADFMGASNPGGRSVGAGGEMSVTTVGNYFLVATLASALLAARLPQWRRLFAVVFAIGAMGIVFTMARSALLLLVAGLLWFAFKIRNARYLPAVVLLAGLAAVAVVPILPDKVTDRFSELGDPSADWTLGRRLGYHIVGLELVAEHPVLGVGPGNFGEYYASFQFRFVEGRRMAERALHNTYLGVAAEYGLLGLGLLVAMILLVLRGLQHASKLSRDPELAHMAEALHFGFVVFLIGMAQLPGLHYKMFWVLIGLGMALAAIAEREAATSPATRATSGVLGTEAGVTA